MGQAIGAVLGHAAGVAIRPLPVSTVILMPVSGRGRTNSLSFTSGWVPGILAAGAGATIRAIEFAGGETASVVAASS